MAAGRVRVRCIYCASSPAEGHKGFCLTRMEAAREEWIPGKVVDPTQGPQEGQRLSTWPRSPDCRDVNCHKCPGEAWDLERDQAVDCQCDCHPPANWADLGRAITQGIAEGLAARPPSRDERRHPPK